MKGKIFFITLKMKTALLIVCAAALITGAPIVISTVSAAVPEPAADPKLAIIIDDFGQDRSGVRDMLALPCPITAAVLPFMEFTAADAQTAFDMGKEVIVHLPMQSSYNDNPKWFPPGKICIGDSQEQAFEKTMKALNAVPHAVGANIHVGGKSSEQKCIAAGVMSACLEKGLYFVDSRTSSKSACRETAKLVPIFYGERNFFLEHASNKSEAYVKAQIKKAAEYAKIHGEAIVIGHVGPAGGSATVRAIADSLSFLEQEGVKIVPASELVRISGGDNPAGVGAKFQPPSENTDSPPGRVKSEYSGASGSNDRSDIE